MDQKQIELYLKRIQFSKEIRTDAETLSALIKAHLESVPFEDLDIYDFKKIPALHEEALFQKIVVEKRGGYCFELNRILYHLLDGLGFRVYPIVARILWGRDFRPALGHMAIVAVIDGTSYLCDVGYGGPGPKGLVRMSEDVQSVQDASFRFSRQKEEYTLERLHQGEWKPVFCFSDRPYDLVDFEPLNYFMAANPQTLFNRARILNLCTPNGSKALTDLELKIVENGIAVVKNYRNMEELQQGIEVEFGIPAGIWKS